MEKRSNRGINRGIMKVYFDAGNTVMQNYEQEAIEKKVIEAFQDCNMQVKKVEVIPVE